MILLISLALAELFLLLCVKLLKKYPGIFYGTAALFSAVVTGLYWAAPDGLSPVLLNKFPLWLGALGTSCFIEVMSVGALPNSHGRMKKVMPIRGELSIFACLLTLGQNLSYGKNYLMPGYLLSGPVSAVKTAAWFSIVMIVLMLVLTVTSIKAVRRRFLPKRWKAVQRWVNLFYGLIYIHVLLMNIPGFLKERGGCGLMLAAYSVVFFSYALCRVRKAILLHKGQASRVTNRSQMADAAAGTALSLLFVAGLHFSIPSAVPVPAAPQVSELLSQEPNEAVAEPELKLDLEKESVSPSAMDKTSADAPEPDEPETAEPASEPLPEPPPEIESEPEPEPEPMLEPSFKYQNGTFTGTGEGYYGPVTVSVTISQDVVTSIVINNRLDDEDYFSDAEKGIIPAILSGQSRKCPPSAARLTVPRGLWPLCGTRWLKRKIDRLSEGVSVYENFTHYPQLTGVGFTAVFRLCRRACIRGRQSLYCGAFRYGYHCETNCLWAKRSEGRRSSLQTDSGIGKSAVRNRRKQRNPPCQSQ